MRKSGYRQAQKDDDATNQVATIARQNQQLVSHNIFLKEAVHKLVDAYERAVETSQLQQTNIQGYHLYSKKLTDLIQAVRKHCPSCNANCTEAEHFVKQEKWIGRKPTPERVRWYRGLRDNQAAIDEYMMWEDKEAGVSVAL